MWAGHQPVACITARASSAQHGPCSSGFSLQSDRGLSERDSVRVTLASEPKKPPTFQSHLQ